MKAPSEKHLEDWIVGNLPTFQEQLQSGVDADEVCLVARQLPLPSGRPDLIYKNKYQLFVVELKKGLINEDCIAQVIRYLGDLKRMWRYQMMIAYEYIPGDKEQWMYSEYEDHSLLGGAMPEIECVVLGEAVANEALMFAQDAAFIRIVTYEFDGNTYHFNAHWHGYEKDVEAYVDCAGGQLGSAIREIMVTRTQRNRDRHDQMAALYGWSKSS